MPQNQIKGNQTVKGALKIENGTPGCQRHGWRQCQANYKLLSLTLESKYGIKEGFFRITERQGKI